MLAMLLDAPGRDLRRASAPVPRAGAGQVLLRVRACGICRTDLHVIDGELPNPKLPLVPGHEIVGEVAECGPGTDGLAPGDRVGVPWLAWTCGTCRYCRAGRENLCDRARFTGYQVDGGYAEYTVADARYCFPLPIAYTDGDAAPLLCAGLIGHRSLRATGDAERLGIYGFGAAAHIVAQVARPRAAACSPLPARATGGSGLRARAGRRVGGASTERPPEALDAAIIFAPVGALVPEALRAVAKAGIVVCAGST